MALQKVKPFNVDILKIHRVDQGKGFAIRGALVLLKVQPLNVEIVETHQQRQIWIAQKWQWSRVLNKWGKKGAKLQN